MAAAKGGPDPQRCLQGDGLVNVSLADIRQCHFAGHNIPGHSLRLALAADPRAGAAALLDLARSRVRRRRTYDLKAHRLLRLERRLWAQGVEHIAGVDEAGMGPLAGPVVAAAVILPRHCLMPGLDDSKRLSAQQRETLDIKIRERALAVAIAQVEAAEIDCINIYQAGLKAMEKAVDSLTARPDHLLVDARTLRHIRLPQQAIIHGDALSASIAAASVVAKVARDRQMKILDSLYPGYGLGRHMGYGTDQHRRALARLGFSPIHRKSFNIKEI